MSAKFPRGGEQDLFWLEVYKQPECEEDLRNNTVKHVSF